MIKQYLWILSSAAVLILFSVVMDKAFAEDSFENTMKKLEALENNGTKVEYDKIQPIKDQYCLISTLMKQY